MDTYAELRELKRKVRVMEERLAALEVVRGYEDDLEDARLAALEEQIVSEVEREKAEEAGYYSALDEMEKGS